MFGALWSVSTFKRSRSLVLGAVDGGRLFQSCSNHTFKLALSSGVSAHWISETWSEGVRPSPSVVKGQWPVMTRRFSPSLMPMKDCGSDFGVARASAFVSSHFAKCSASERAPSLLRNGRSDSPPSNAVSNSSASGTTKRQLEMEPNSFASSPNACSDNADVAMSMTEPLASDRRSSSMTRSLPAFLMSLMRPRFPPANSSYYGHHQHPWSGCHAPAGH